MIYSWNNTCPQGTLSYQVSCSLLQAFTHRCLLPLQAARPLAKESRLRLGVIVFFFSGIMRPVFSGELSLRVDEVCKHWVSLNQEICEGTGVHVCVWLCVCVVWIFFVSCTKISLFFLHFSVKKINKDYFIIWYIWIKWKAWCRVVAAVVYPVIP